MKILFLIFLLIPGNALAAKILFDLKGKQNLVEVGQGGSITSDATILWDEREHGAIPEVEVGAMEHYDEEVPLLDDRGEPVLDKDQQPRTKIVRKLRVDLDKKAGKEAAEKRKKDEKDAADAAKTLEDKEYADAVALLDKSTNTVAELKRVLKAILKRK